MDPNGAIWSYWEPFEVILRNFNQFGAILSQLEPFGSIWIHLEIFRAIERYLELFGAISSHLESFGAISSHLEPFEAIWSLTQFLWQKVADLKIYLFSATKQHRVGPCLLSRNTLSTFCSLLYTLVVHGNWISRLGRYFMLTPLFINIVINNIF